MSRRRYISTTQSLHTYLCLLYQSAGAFAVLLYSWMIPHAEDDGRLTGTPNEQRLQVVPGLAKRTTEDMIAALGAMDPLGLIQWREVLGWARSQLAALCADRDPPRGRGLSAAARRVWAPRARSPLVSRSASARPR